MVNDFQKRIRKRVFFFISGKLEFLEIDLNNNFENIELFGWLDTKGANDSFIKLKIHEQEVKVQKVRFIQRSGQYR